MATQPFQDGFPNQAQAAINASYFLSNEDRNEWFEWLKTADEQQQDELINILHTMWEDAQRQGNTQQGTQPIQNNPQPNYSQQIGQQNQPSVLDTNIVQPMVNAMTNIGTNNQPIDPNANQPINQGNIDQSFSLAKKEVEAISQPKMNQENIEAPVAYTPTAAIADVTDEGGEDSFEFDTEEDIKGYKPEPFVEAKKSKKPLIEDDLDSGTDEDIDTSNNEENLESTATPRRAATSSIDFTSIRDNTKKDEILSVKEAFVNSRTAHEESFNGFVEKVTTVMCEFEEINDYIEAMTDKVLAMNDEVISQAQDIQSLKNQTQNRGGSLQDQIDEAKYDVEKILKEIRNIRIEMKRSNDELRSRLSILEADSFRAENDGINQKLSVIKSELSKLQDANSSSQPQTFSQQFQSRTTKLGNIKFDK
jgi:hypothetical protein